MSQYRQFLETRLGDDWAGVRDQILQWAGRVPAGVS